MIGVCALTVAAAAFDTFKPKTGRPFSYEVEDGFRREWKIPAKNVLSVNNEMICFKNKGRVLTLYTQKIKPII